MNIPAKASIAIGTIGALAWVGLFALFYRSANDYGKYSEMNFGQVRGESVKRFQLPKDSILLSSKRGQNEYKDDALLISKESPSSDSATIYVVRGSVLIFEQKVSSEYNDIEWEQENNRFSVSSPNEKFYLIPAEKEYVLSASE